MCILIPPTETLGNRVMDDELLRQIWDARGDRERVTALARALGSAHGLPEADHFHVPCLTPYEPVRDEDGRLVVLVAAWTAS